ncbi:MAG: deaminase [Rhabdochlamydiaceae bacterium]|jgi:ornithine cyclodeaminase
MRIFYKKEIQKALNIQAVLESIEKGFVIYSKKEAIIPPVAALHLDNPPGECHIKYGYAKEGDYYIVKIASGFFNNPSMGLPASNGLMLLFDRSTGAPVCILLDEGYLTDIRTAAAGCIAAKYLAPKQVQCIGIVGTGAQAYFQLKFLQFATDCRKVLVWGREEKKAHKFCEHPDLKEFHIEIAKDLNQLTSHCNLIVTTTSSTTPLLFSNQISPGTHITAMGADDLGKQELDPHLLARADRVVVDSYSQCALFGDVSHALKERLLDKKQLRELGEVILDPSLRRSSKDQLTIADLTGIAIQDLQIATITYETLLKKFHGK